MDIFCFSSPNRGRRPGNILENIILYLACRFILDNGQEGWRNKNKLHPEIIANMFEAMTKVPHKDWLKKRGTRTELRTQSTESEGVYHLLKPAFNEIMKWFLSCSQCSSPANGFESHSVWQIFTCPFFYYLPQKIRISYLELVYSYYMYLVHLVFCKF